MFKQALQCGLTGLLLLIDGVVYWAVSKLFDLYASLAGAEIIKESFFEQLLNRVYVVIGIFMLFVIAYSLLKSLVNPDNLVKDMGKIIPNIIISLVLLGVTPTLFNYARQLQSAIIDDGIIEKIFLVETVDIKSTGNSTSFNVLSAFLSIPGDVRGWSPSINAGLYEDDGEEHHPGISGEGTITWNQLTNKIKNENWAEGFLDLGYFAEPVHNAEDHNITYIPIISTICGAFLGYVILSFCLDLGIRVVKLAFYQIIAPIPILMRIIPEKKSVFDNWTKGTIATYMEVFIRLVIMFLIVWMTSAIFNGNIIETDNDIGIFGKVIIVLGLFAFAKQAPKLIGDVIGVDSGNIKLGIMGKLAAGGALGFAAMLGGVAGTGIKNLTGGVKNATNRWASVGKERGFGNKFSAALKATGASTVGLVGSIGAGMISGGLRSAKGGFTAKNFKETASAVSEGVRKAIDKRDARDNYRATHGDSTLRVAGGHIADYAKKFGQYAGITAGFEALKKEQSKVQETSGAVKALTDRAKAIMEKQSAERVVSRGNEKRTTWGQMFNNLSDIQNELNTMRTRGFTSSGDTVTNAMIREMQQVQFDLEKQLQKDIISGLDKDGLTVNMNKYDTELMSAASTLRTKVQSSYNNILQNADRDIPEVNTALGNLEIARSHQNQPLKDFITSGNLNKLFDAKDAIDNANRELSVELNARIQKEQENQKK